MLIDPDDPIEEWLRILARAVSLARAGRHEESLRCLGDSYFLSCQAAGARGPGAGNVTEIYQRSVENFGDRFQPRRPTRRRAA